MPREKEPTILVGFGKHELTDLMKNIGTEEGEKILLEALDKHHWPPRYRPFRICSEEQAAAFVEYMSWVKSKLNIKG